MILLLLHAFLSPRIGYNAYREVCSLGPAAEWSDFEDVMSPENVIRRAPFGSAG